MGVLDAPSYSRAQTDAMFVAPDFGVRELVAPDVWDATGTTDVSAIFNRAAVAANAAYVATGRPQTVFIPAGRYKLTSEIVPLNGVVWIGAAEAAVVFLPYGNVCAFKNLTATLGAPVTDAGFYNFTIDGANQTNATYTTAIKGIFIQFMLRPVWSHLTIRNTWATGLGCDFLQDYTIEHVTADGCGRGIGETATDPGATSGGSGIGIGTGAYQVEAGVITSPTTVNNGKNGLFFEKQAGKPYFSRGQRVTGALSSGNYVGLHDCGCDGLVFDGTLADNTYAGLELDGTILTPDAGINGRVNALITRNGDASVANSGGVVVGASSSGPYVVNGTIASNVGPGVSFKPGAVVAPGFVFDADVHSNSGAGYLVRAADPIVSARIAGRARNNGTDTSLTYRAGVVILAETDLLDLDIIATDDQAAKTQTYGVQILGVGLSCSRARLQGDVRSYLTGPGQITQTVSNDSVQRLDGFDTSGPSSLSGTPGDGQVALLWHAPIPSLGVTDYSIQYRAVGSGTWLDWSHAASTSTGATVTGLTNGAVYEFQVAAVTAGGTGGYTAGPTSVSPRAPDLYADSFNRADSSSSLGTAAEGSSSAAWSVLATSGGTWGVSSNAAKCTTGNGTQLAVIDTTNADGTVQSTMTALNGTVSARASGLAFRCTDASNYLVFQAKVQGTNANFYSLVRRVGGTATVLATTSIVPAVSDVLKVVFVGSSIKCYVNGVLAATVTEATYASITKHGLYGNNTADGTAKWDDWSYNTALV